MNDDDAAALGGAYVVVDVVVGQPNVLRLPAELMVVRVYVPEHLIRWTSIECNVHIYDHDEHYFTWLYTSIALLGAQVAVQSANFN